MDSLKNIHLVEVLKAVASSPKVNSFDDDDPGLDDLPIAFLERPVEAICGRWFAEERAHVVGCANNLLSLFTRELSEDEMEEIEEDLRYRGMPSQS